ncbi:MAG TPA: c-type cytochrome [Pyrinomonadaceae bacterium]|nr:c-type cytochrome [Pyrinomonadaceae bacterium]
MKRFLKQLAILVAVVLFSVILIDAARPASLVGVSSGSTEVDRSAAALYKSYCASCHGSDGRAKTIKGRLSHARDISDAQWQDNVSDERLFNSISNGRGKMPAFSKKLSETEIDSLVNYVRRLRK